MTATSLPDTPKYPLGFLLFSFQGRIGNVAYLVTSLIAFFVLVVIILTGLSIVDTANRASGRMDFGNPVGVVAVILLGILLLVNFVAHLALGVKRLHDMDLHGSLILLNFVPYLNFLFLLWLIFGPGTKGPNQYGERRGATI